MASLERHKLDCVDALGESFQEVHEWLDALFSLFGPMHRKVRHHKEGIAEIKARYGERAAIAAKIHILRDCRHIPSSKDYETGYVDALGLKKQWPVTAYIRYTEEDFKSVIKNQVFGPTGLMLWAFIDRPTFPGFLNSVTRLTPQEVEELIPKWALAAEVRSTLSPLPRPVLPSSPIDPPVREYVESFEQTPIFQALRQQFKKATFAYVPCDMLVNPLVFIDNEFLDNIKPELQSTEPIDVVKFALPTQISAEVKAVTDPSMHNVYFVTNLKTLTVGPAQILQTPVGTEVKFLINSNLSITLVSAQDRFIIRNGIHRAFLLARLGIKNISLHPGGGGEFAESSDLSLSVVYSCNS